MASNVLRKEVLKSFKNLHRTRCLVFKNSIEHLEKVRQEINDAYKKNKDITDIDSIREMVQIANDVVYELKTTIVEMEEVAPGRFKLHLRPEMFQEEVPKKLTK